MTQTQENNLSPNELLKKRNLMLNACVESEQQKLSKEEIAKIKKDYVGMYFALTSINWGQGMTLGMAWQKALTQMDAFIESKMKIANHPANIELLKYHTERRRLMAETAMKSEYANEKLTECQRKVFFKDGEEILSASKKSLDSTYEKHMPKQKESKNPVNVQFKLANLNMKRQLWAFQQTELQRA